MNRFAKAWPVWLCAVGVSCSGVSGPDTVAGPAASARPLAGAPNRGPQPRVTFVIDDGRLTDVTVKLPVFVAHRAVAVAAVPSKWRQLSDAQLLELQNVYGWEIANHGRWHRNEILLNDSTLIEELTQSVETFAKLGLRVAVHVYPYGASTLHVEEIVSRYFRAGIKAWGGVNPLPIRDRYTITRTILDRTVLDSAKTGSLPGRRGVGSPYNLQWWQGLVRRTERTGGWLIVSIHELCPEDLALLGDLIDYIKARNIPIVTLSQGLDMH